MSSKMGLYVLLLVAITADITTVAGEFENCETLFVPIPEEEQNVDPKTLTNLTSRPLGYESTVIPFNDPKKHDPCFTVNVIDSQKQTILVMAKGVSGNPNICMKSNRPGAQPTCQAGLKTCEDSAIGGNTKNIKYMFYCEGCETDLTIWFRFTLSPNFTNGLDFENWCAQPGAYPNSLIVLTADPITTPTPTSGLDFGNWCTESGAYPNSRIVLTADPIKTRTPTSSANCLTFRIMLWILLSCFALYFPCTL